MEGSALNPGDGGVEEGHEPIESKGGGWKVVGVKKEEKRGRSGMD